MRRGERIVELTPTEFHLLRYLLVERRPGREQGADPRSCLALRLRRRRQRGGDLHQLPAQEGRPRAASPLIQTVRGFGYALRMPRR